MNTAIRRMVEKLGKCYEGSNKDECANYYTIKAVLLAGLDADFSEKSLLIRMNDFEERLAEYDREVTCAYCGVACDVREWNESHGKGKCGEFTFEERLLAAEKDLDNVFSCFDFLARVPKPSDAECKHELRFGGGIGSKIPDQLCKPSPEKESVEACLRREREAYNKLYLQVHDAVEILKGLRPRPDVIKVPASPTISIDREVAESFLRKIKATWVTTPKWTQEMVNALEKGGK